MRRLKVLAAVVLAMVCVRGRAQIGLYGAFSAAKLDAPNTDWIEGVTFGAYDDKVHLPVVNFGVDLRGAALGGSGATQVQSGMIGPRAVAHLPIVPLHPYVEGLVGAGHVQVGQGVAYTSATHLEYGLAAGLDLTFFPRLDWRVVDYQYGGFRGSRSEQTISTGLVFRLPIP